LTAAGKKMIPTEVAKIIGENLPAHEIIGKVCSPMNDERI
jgi:hypothetical protein